MYVKDLTPDNIFIKRFRDREDGTYFVSEEIKDDTRTIVVTKNILKAKHYTTKEAYQEAYNSLGESERQIALTTEEESESLSRHVAHMFIVLETSELYYFYNNSVQAEKTLLTNLGFDALIVQPATTITEV